MRPSTCTSPIFQLLIFQYWLHFHCILISRLLMFQYRLHPPLTQSYWSRPCYKTACCAAPSWKQTDKSSIGITKWGSRDQRVCIGIAIITYWASPNLCPSVAGTAIKCLWRSVIHFVVPVSALGSSKWSALHWFQTEGCNRQAYENQLLCLGLNCCGLLANCCAGACFLTSCLMTAHRNTHNTTTDTPHNTTRRWLMMAQRLGLQRRSARPTTNNYSPSSNSSLAISQTFHSMFSLDFSWNLFLNFCFGRIL